DSSSVVSRNPDCAISTVKSGEAIVKVCGMPARQGSPWMLWQANRSYFVLTGRGVPGIWWCRLVRSQVYGSFVSKITGWGDFSHRLGKAAAVGWHRTAAI